MHQIYAEHESIILSAGEHSYSHFKVSYQKHHHLKNTSEENNKKVNDNRIKVKEFIQ